MRSRVSKLKQIKGRTFSRQCVYLLQAFLVVRFVLQYVIPVGTFAYCYGRIFHVIRRQSKVFTGQAGRGQDVAMATTSRGQNTGQVQQQATAATTGVNKLSRTELNVIQTMVVVVVGFMMCFSLLDIFNFLAIFRVSH